MGAMRATTLLRYIVTGLAAVTIVPVVGQYAINWATTAGWYTNPENVVAMPVRALATMAGIWWLQPLAIALVGLTVGVWLDWLARRFDQSRESDTRALGRDLVSFAGRTMEGRPYLEETKRDVMHRIKPEAITLFVRIQKLKIPAPNNPFASGEEDKAYDFLRAYFAHIGPLLRDGYLKEAKEMAEIALQAVNGTAARRGAIPGRQSPLSTGPGTQR